MVVREAQSRGFEVSEEKQTAEVSDVNTAGARNRMRADGTPTSVESTKTKDPLGMAVAAAGMTEDMDVAKNDGQGMKRLSLAFPETCSLTLPEKYTWYMALLKQRPGCRPLF